MVSGKCCSYRIILYISLCMYIHSIIINFKPNESHLSCSFISYLYTSQLDQFTYCENRLCKFNQSLFMSVAVQCHNNIMYIFLLFCTIVS